MYKTQWSQEKRPSEPLNLCQHFRHLISLGKRILQTRIFKVVNEIVFLKITHHLTVAHLKLQGRNKKFDPYMNKFESVR